MADEFSAHIYARSTCLKWVAMSIMRIGSINASPIMIEMSEPEKPSVRRAS
eukprot:COSAG05_NODE_536_length_8861_cov_4.614700_7_plen_51_part_00